MAGNTVVVLGGGVGGLTTGNELRRRLGPEHKVILVDKSGEHLFAPSLLWLMVGERRPEQLTKNLRAMVRPGVQVVAGQVEEVDTERGRVTGEGIDLGYDAVVISLGATLAPDALPGFASGAYNFFDLDGAIQLRDELKRFRGGRAVVAVAALPFKCPAAPYEAALLIEDAVRRQGVRDKTEISVFTPEPQPMPVAGPVLGTAVVDLLSQRGIRFCPNHLLQQIDAEAHELVFQDGSREGFDLLAGVPPHRPPSALRGSPLVNEAGWVTVEKHTLRTRTERVYALGDVTAIPLANGKLLPKAGTFAHAEALVVAQNLAAEIQGGPTAPFDGVGYCWLETGGGEAAFASGDFYAEPDPAVRLRNPGQLWHLGKVFFEHYWMGEGIERTAARLSLAMGSKALGISAAL